MEENNENQQLQPLNKRLRSENSNKKAYVRFVNLTNLTIEIVWVNFSGHYIRYQLLRKGTYINIDTFETHPWIALDVQTKDRMLIGGQYFFMPKAHSGDMQNSPNLIRPIATAGRKIVCITLPMYSLRYLALLAARNLFENAEEVDRLEVPTLLADDLKRVINLRNKSMAKNITVIH